MRIGRARFKDVADACGVTDTITDLNVLRLKPCLIFVKIETDESGEYPPKNRITRVRRIEQPQGATAVTNGKFAFDDKVPF